MSFRRAIQGSICLYRQLLCVYPADFRQAYGREMLLLFTTKCHQIVTWHELLQLWFVTLRDLLTNVTEETLMLTDRNRRLIRIPLLFGVIAGCLGSINVVSYPVWVGESGEKIIAYLVLFGVLALALGAGLIAGRISQRTATGLWVGLLVGVITSLLANTARVGFSIAFYNIVRHDPNEIRDWMHRGSGSFVDYLIEDRIGGYIYVTLLLGVLCSALGIAGSWINKTTHA